MTQRGRQRPGWNPARRNRNIGTAKQGHGQNNRMVIPYLWNRPSSNYYEQLGSHIIVARRIHGQLFRFIIEKSRSGVAYAVTIDDLVRLMWLIPKEDLEGLALIVLRQPTRKQELLSPMWGRLGYLATIGKLEGPAIFLEAVNRQAPFRWPYNLRPDEVRELERIRTDGHGVKKTRRGYVLVWNFESIRSTQLSRTFPHEVGHWVDWLQKVVRPAAGDWKRESALSQSYFSRPASEHEDFAHRYADAFRARLSTRGEIPFPRQFDLSRMRRDKLRPLDFGIDPDELLPVETTE